MQLHGIAGEDANGFLTEVATAFNNSSIKINGVPVSVGIRSISSNLSADFILSEKYTPDAFIPSSKYYGLMLDTKEKKYTLVSEGLTHNVSGVVISKNINEKLKNKYGEVTGSVIVNSVLNGEAVIGYTNPLSNDDGLNYLITVLSTFDANYILSDEANSKLRAYQDKTPYVSYDVIQLQDSIRNGTIDGFATNYQVYYTTPALRNSYDFVPFGINQDYPVYTIGELPSTKMDILNKFIEFVKNDENVQKATNKGYNGFSNYVEDSTMIDGRTIVDAQEMWKKEKNGSSDLTAVFVADVSGSMEGSPLLKLKASLNRASTFIDENTNIGLVTFSDNVNIALPIAKFDNIQKSYFSSAVKSMKALGGTAMFDAIIVAEKMLVDAQEKNPNTRLMMFVLTDGESNRGFSFDEIVNVTKGLRIPIYTIGYNADIDVLQEVSDINEALTMDADSDNIIYKLESLFDAQM